MGNVKHYPPEGFTKRLRDLWIESGLSQKKVAEMIGYERKTIHAWINGDSMPNIIAFARLCYVFGVTADYLLFGKEVNNGGN